MAVTAADIVNKFAPKAKANYVTAFHDEAGLIGAAGISTPLRLAHFMAQCLHETGAFTILVESGRYTAKNLASMWDAGNWHKYFASRDDCIAMADQCAVDQGEALFSLVYGNRMGNGPPASHDGWTYRGRGILQTTGRESYAKFGKKCGVDFEGNPDLVAAADHALKPALAEWTGKNINTAADHDDIKLVTYLVNGGYNGLDERKAWFARIWPFVIGGQPAQQSVAWRLQEALNKAGFDCGAPDGVVGTRTRAAILAYRAKRGLVSTPDVTADLLSSLGIG